MCLQIVISLIFMVKGKNFYKLVGETLEDSWKRTSDGKGVVIKWDDEIDKFIVLSKVGDIMYYDYEEFFFHHTLSSNKKSFNPKEIISSVICILNGLDTFNTYESKNVESKYRDKHNLRQYVSERYEDVHYGISNNIDMPFLTENVLEFLKS